MRLVIIILVIVLFSKCSENDKSEVITQFLSEQLNSKQDYRLFVPPPPPSINDSTYYKGKMKPDSIIGNLQPLDVYIGDSIQYDSIFKLKTVVPKDFSFIKKKTSITSKQLIAINFSSIDVSKKNIIIRGIQFNEFMKILPSIRYDDNYDGIISFHNLFFSANGKKAYFEIYYFKGKQNSGSRAVFAELENGKWKYQTILISIS